MDKTGTKRFVRNIVWLLLLGCLGGGAFVVFRDMAPPVLSIEPDRQAVSYGTQFAVSAVDEQTGLKGLDVFLVQGDKKIELKRKVFAEGTQRYSEPLRLDKDMVKPGPFEIVAQARDRSYYFLGKAGRSTLSRQYVLDVTPPRITVEGVQHNVNQGGCGLVAYTLSEEVQKSGVKVGELFFPGFKQASGKYYCLFAMPHNVPPDEFKPLLFARDPADNESTRPFPVHAMAKSFRKDKMPVSDNFLNQVMPQFKKYFPNEPDLLSLYLKVNRTLRETNAQELYRIGQATAPAPLWQGAFLRLPNAAPMAGFGDRRAYIYDNEKIDDQTHLGIDLASLKNADVPAANEGVVVFAGELGIYGNAVVVDHGLGLQTLYAHLSQIEVAKGARVGRGQTIGRTGETGLAGGDHLHYGVLVSGVAVNPTEWWDPHWIKDNVTEHF